MYKSFKFIFLLVLVVFIANTLKAQTPNRYQPFSHQFYQKFDDKIYGQETKFHSSIRPYFIDDTILKPSVDSFFNINVDTNKKKWAHRKLFQEHLFDVKNKEFTVFADFLPDFNLGYDEVTGQNTWLNTRGYQLGGTIGDKFFFYTSGFENQAKFPSYITAFVNENGIIPGEVNDKFGTRKSIKDWAYATAILSYTPVKYLNITLGQDKNFIGDGYRSMLLSDVAANYPFLKLTANLSNVKYMAMWAQFQDLKSPQFSYDNGFRKKWGVFHYLDWNVTDRLSVGLFDAIIWQDADSTGKRGFDFSYVNPLIFLRPVEGQNGSPDNALVGLNLKYELFKNLTVYGQFLADEFTAKEVFAGNGYWANKFAYQVGIRGFDMFRVKRLNYLFEFNTARPFTYTQRSSLLNFGHYNQPLAHLYGANFREAVGILNYSIGNFDFYSKVNLAQYGLDATANDNVGKDIYKPYGTRNSDYNNITTQGLKTSLLVATGRISYLINPKYNLRLELGGLIRSESNDRGDRNTALISFGLRSSFRNFYDDF